MRLHSFHPDILFRDARSELSDPLWAASAGNASTDEVARLVATCTRLDHSYQGPKDPEEIVRAALERDGETYHEPTQPNASLSMRALLSSTPEASGNGHPYPVRQGRRGSNGEGDSFGSTPRARMRDRLHPHMAPLGTSALVDTALLSSSPLADDSMSSSYSYTYPHRSLETPIERTPSSASQSFSLHPDQRLACTTLLR